MRSFVCHKRVQAEKITAIGPDGQSLELADGTTRMVSSEYMKKHDPKPGGYYVLYADGYESWSPAEAFESGYVAE